MVSADWEWEGILATFESIKVNLPSHGICQQFGYLEVYVYFGFEDVLEIWLLCKFKDFHIFLFVELKLWIINFNIHVLLASEVGELTLDLDYSSKGALDTLEEQV